MGDRERLKLNPWGEEIEPEDVEDPFWVPEDQRKDIDEGEMSDALTEETGDDMGDWEPDKGMRGRGRDR